jgi:3-carboxy-cis,cis-muconate cycloisomerase
MLDFEAALARACASAGLVPADAAAAISAACQAEQFDIAALGRDAAASGNPAVPLIASLRAKLPGDVADHVHRGATSQDVIDTAAMLVARRALGPILDHAATAVSACTRLAAEHRETVMIGRTLLQQAVPTTFGLKAAGWLAGVARARRQLVDVGERQVALQFGGAAGTLAALGEAADEVAAALGRELELAVPPLPWHTERSRPVLIADGLALLSGSFGKIARDVTLLAQNEVGEVRLARGGGSSAMPHKRNPVAAVAVLACAARTSGLAATINASLVQEHERATGAWHAEWESWSDLLRLTGAAAAWTAELLDGLEVDGERMRCNLKVAGEVVMAESVVMALSPKLGGGAARELVQSAVHETVQDDGSLRAALARRTQDALSPGELDAALAPESYVGAARPFVDRAIAEYRGG